MTDELVKDIPTLKFVANDLYLVAKGLQDGIDAGVLRVILSPIPDKATELVVTSLRALAVKYSVMANAQSVENKKKELNTKAPEPFQPPPVESKRIRGLKKKLDTLAKPAKKGAFGRPVSVPRDFMAQAVAMGLGKATLTAMPILRWMLVEPACKHLFVREPTLEQVRDTLSAGSRDPKNPRFIRVKQGWYKNNPDYKKTR